MDYKHTLNLPKTAFPMKAELPKREPEMLKHWAEQDLYGLMRKTRAKSGKRFILHDGPPYANGDIHIGHALNKILKDIIVRYKTLQGFDAPYVPGWDCHGMPIEHQLFKDRKLNKATIRQQDFRKLAAEYAQKYVGLQREQFKRLGVMGDWEHPYLTMSREYGLSILRTFKELVRDGYIYRGKKPVYWCTTCETALAEAEVEYEDRTDTAIFVAFPLAKPPTGFVYDEEDWKGAAVAVWTTTPWTLPANVALCFHPHHSYVVAKLRMPDGNEKKLIVAEQLLETVVHKLGASLIGKSPGVSGSKLAGTTLGGQRQLYCRHPFGRADSVGVCDEGLVTLDQGTGIVHIAPGHGLEDYQVGQREKLEVFSPVDHQGRYTSEAGSWVGQTVWDANPKIVEDLRARGLLLADEKVAHSYPHCWRCKRPVIFRATPQWFLSVEHKALRGRLKTSAQKVNWVPSVGLSRISGMLEARPDWCLSRQRYWGSPIPVLHCKRCDQPLLDVAVIEAIERSLSERGLEAWFGEEPLSLAPDARCGQCGENELRKDTDILDVWFDSGVSHEAVLRSGVWKDLASPADLYLEGSDQHRGWFQVSLMTSVALHDQAPYRAVLTHGFVMDGAGRKMSKSLGNVVAPQDVMQRYGADILRLWVATSDYREDVRISDEILGQAAESYRKIRNTFRYLLANLADYQPGRDTVWPGKELSLDRWILAKATDLHKAVTRSYDAYQFHEAARAIYQFCVSDLSAFYLDAVKDRLYTDAVSSTSRRCAQTAMYAILHLLVKAASPILAFTADEVWQAMRQAGWVSEPSVHMSDWPAALTPIDGLDEELARWSELVPIRSVVMKALEEQRLKQVIGSPLEASVTLVVRDTRLAQAVRAAGAVLAETFVVSQVLVSDAAPGEEAVTEVAGLAAVRVARAPGAKCERCWKYLTSVGLDAQHPGLCDRCRRVVADLSVERV